MAKRRKKIVRVEWLDAYHQSEDDGSAGVQQVSVGFVIENSKRCVKIAQSLSGTTTDDPDEPREVLTVPRAYVKTITVLEDAR